MKKLLLLGLIAIFAGNVVAVVPQQSLFSDEFIHKPVEVDTDKLAGIGAGKKFDFCRKMIELHNEDTGELSIYKMMDIMHDWHIPANPITLTAFELRSRMAMLYSKIKKDVVGINEPSHVTQDAVRQLIDEHCNSSDTAQEIDNTLVIEILKERKNMLVEEMRGVAMEQICGSSFGDSVPEDYAIIGILGALTLYFSNNPTASVNAAEIKGMLKGIGLSMLFVSNNHLRNYRHALRSREAQMNKIDEIIQKIEAF